MDSQDYVGTQEQNSESCTTVIKITELKIAGTKKFSDIQENLERQFTNSVRTLMTQRNTFPRKP